MIGLAPHDRTPNRLRWAIVVALVALALLAPFTIAVIVRGTDAARNETLGHARGHLDDLRIVQTTGEVEPPENTWIVNPTDGWSEPFGVTFIDPPLFALAAPAIGEVNPHVQEFDFEGRWLSYAQWTGGNDAYVTVVEREGEAAAVASLRVRWAAAALALSALAGLLTFIALGRMQAPVRRAYAVNRDFIADAAHELRTPLSIIQASAGFALSRDRPAEEYRESLTEILEASERAGMSVGDLLELARLEAGQAALRLAPMRLDLLVEEVAATVRVDGVSIEAEPGEGVVVEADYNLLRQVIDNIARNAAARATKVTLTTALEGATAAIVVADNGPGFDPGVIDHVFERFRRGDRSGSVGLGMAIARNIVELHGGTCQAANRSDDVGGGAIVTVRVPAKQERV